MTIRLIIRFISSLLIATAITHQIKNPRPRRKAWRRRPLTRKYPCRGARLRRRPECDRGADSMHTLEIGDVTITSIVERDAPWRRPDDMFPAYDPEIGKRHLA